MERNVRAKSGMRGSSLQRLAERLRARRQRPRRLSRIAVAVIVTVLLAMVVVAWPFVMCHLQAIAVLDMVANQPVPAVLRALVLGPVRARDLTLSTPQGAVRARMYTPVKHPDAPALIVLHGVHHLGIDEPRLVAFATAMAACGLRVLTPELPDIKDYHVGASSIATIGEAAEWMAHENSGRPVGVMGLSFSGGLSLLAAADPAYMPSIRFVVAVGSQDEMSRVAAYYRTGSDALPGGTLETLPPHEYGALVMEYENLADFVPKGDVQALRPVLRAHLYEDVPGEAAARARLTATQQVEAATLLDTSSEATRDKLAAAESRHIAEMAAVSPHGHLGTLTTPVYLLHGEGDNIIPSAETLWMADELPRGTLEAELISPVISHLDMDGHAPSELDRLRLVHFFALVLHAAEVR